MSGSICARVVPDGATDTSLTPSQGHAAYQSDTISAAARWLADGGRDPQQPVVKQLKERFGLSAGAAVSAIHEANRLRALPT